MTLSAETEWQFGYQRRFGLYHVDFHSLKRTPKASALYYRDVISAHRTQSKHRQLVKAVRRKQIPDKVVIGYASNPDVVPKAVKDGVNVIAWAFVDLDCSDTTTLCEIRTNLDLHAVRSTIENLEKQGYTDTIHLMSIGGWNGPHLIEQASSPDVWFESYQLKLASIFDGIDWDLEGNDDVKSPYNEFGMVTLQRMASISRLVRGGAFCLVLSACLSSSSCF